jgi:endonuclease/exonuclease/phosphatase (EEP) superfamily protein YafD
MTSQDAADSVWKTALGAVTRLGALVALLAPLSLLPAYPAQLIEPFRLQLLFGCAAIAALAALLRLRGWFDVAALCALLNFALVAPTLAAAPRPPPSGGVPVRLLLANVLTSNTRYQDVVRAARELKPDLIALVETDRRWYDALAPGLADYRGQRFVEHSGNFGLALFARGDLRVDAEYLGSSLPTLVGTVALPGAAPLQLLLTHPPPPLGEDAVEVQRSQLAAVARRARALAPPIILAGDLNTTPWSAAFARLLATSGLYDSREGFGVQASFPADPRGALVRIPIDHVLLSSDIAVRTRRVERDIGSDHLPVLIDLVVPPQLAAPVDL